MFTREELAKKLEAARAAERAARTRAAGLRRELSAVGRRQEAQYRCALGGTLLAMVARGTPDDLHAVDAVRAYLRQHPPHDSNMAVLVGTPFDPADAPEGYRG